MITDSVNRNPVSSSEPRDRIVRRIRALWIGLAVYTLIMVNGFRYVYVLPYQVVIVGSLINATMVVTFVVALKRAYRRLQS